MLKIKNIKPGDVLELVSPSGAAGYVTVLKLDDFGLLIQLGDIIHEGRSENQTIVYMNPHGAKKWNIVRNIDVENIASKSPTFFFGSSFGFWTVDSKEGRKHIQSEEATYEDLLARGFVFKVLWNGARIEAYFDGKPLVWDGPRP